MASNYKGLASELLKQKASSGQTAGSTNWQMQSKDPGRGVQRSGSNTWQMQAKDPGRPDRRAGSKTWQMSTTSSLVDRLLLAAQKGTLHKDDIAHAINEKHISRKEGEKVMDAYRTRYFQEVKHQAPAHLPKKPVR